MHPHQAAERAGRGRNDLIGAALSTAQPKGLLIKGTDKPVYCNCGCGLEIKIRSIWGNCAPDAKTTYCTAHGLIEKGHDCSEPPQPDPDCVAKDNSRGHND